MKYFHALQTSNKRLFQWFVEPWQTPAITFMAPITTAADDILKYVLFFFYRK